MALSEADIEAVADRVADLLRTDRATEELVDAAEVARRFGVSRDFVYAHADDLGAVRLGHGPKARLRFRLAEAGRILRREPERPNQPSRRTAKRRRTSALLPVRGGGNA
jgi:hypothetical protein